MSYRHLPSYPQYDAHPGIDSASGPPEEEPSITVTSPNGAEAWDGGDVHAITWTSSNVSTVLVEYSLDNGSSWLTAAAGVSAAGGAYAWTVPESATEIAVVRVSDEASSASDVSNAVFEIAVPPPPEGALQQYPSVTLAEIAENWAGFEDIDPPSVSGAILESPWSTLHTVAAANPGRQIRCTTSAGVDAAGGLNACTDVEILVPDGVQLGVMYIENCTRVRLRGEGPTSRCDGIRARYGSSHVTAHSLLIPGSGSGDSVSVLDADHVAFISCIIGGATNSNCGLLSDDTLTDVLFANCNFGSPDNGGVNDWVLRFGVLDRLVMVDCFCEARGLQPVLRRSAATKSLFLRVTTYNEFDNESFADVGVGDADHILTDCYLRDCVSYLSADGSFRFGGYNASATNKSVIWRVYDHAWHTEIGGTDVAAALASLESGEETAGDWEYRLGTPTYDDAWNGVHPGWPTITSSFGFDMDSGGTDPNSPYDIP